MPGEIDKYAKRPSYWKIRNEKIYRKAAEELGRDAQLKICIESMGNLRDALAKFLTLRRGIEEIAEYIAEVELSMGMMKYLFNNKVKVIDYKEAKMARLEGALEC